MSVWLTDFTVSLFPQYLVLFCTYIYIHYSSIYKINKTQQFLLHCINCCIFLCFSEIFQVSVVTKHLQPTKSCALAFCISYCMRTLYLVSLCSLTNANIYVPHVLMTCNSWLWDLPVCLYSWKNNAIFTASLCLQQKTDIFECIFMTCSTNTLFTDFYF